MPDDAIELRGSRGFYRIRFYREAYRIIYFVSEQQRKIVVTRVRKRGPDTYKGL